MKLITALKEIQNISLPIFSTSDIAIQLKISNSYGNKILKRLSDESFICHLRRNLWCFPDKVDPLMLPDYLTAPLPSYISLQTALYFHGMISQIPEVIYAVSLARTRQFLNAMGTFSIHHIQPLLFSGFEIIGPNQIRLASMEKALFDFFYFKPAKTRLFSALPELDIPEIFDWKQFQHFISSIPNARKQAAVLKELKSLAPSLRSPEEK